MEELKKMIYPLDLQLFAEGDDGDGDSGTDKGADNGDINLPKEPEGNKTSFTQEQLDDIISKRLAREKEKWENDQLKAKTEAEKLEKMTEAQKREYAR